LYHSDYLGIQVMKLIFAVIAPLPMLLLHIDFWRIVEKKVVAILFSLFLQTLLIAVFWILINSF